MCSVNGGMPRMSSVKDGAPGTYFVMGRMLTNLFWQVDNCRGRLSKRVMSTQYSFTYNDEILRRHVLSKANLMPETCSINDLTPRAYSVKDTISFY